MRSGRVVDITDVLSASVPLDPNQWSAIIPAAGRGTRLGFDKPKILYPVAGKTILERLIAALDGLVAHYIFVLSPAGSDCVRPHLERSIPGRFCVVFQDPPKGMADAVWAARESVTTPQTLVIWGDQAGISRLTVTKCIEAHIARPGCRATLPTLICADPYISLERDEHDRVTGIVQAREGDPMPTRGETDCGLFCFRTSALFSGLDRIRNLPSARGARTREWNLLPLIPLLDDAQGSVLSVRIHNPTETMGINRPSDARMFEAQQYG